VVLIVPGSGPVDRDGNSGPLRGATYRLLAASLADRGLASVRYDKRGIGASATALSSEKDVRFETYIDDVIAWLTLLRGDARFTKLVVAGHSEGSLLGMLAAQKVPIDAFVSLEGAGRSAPVVLREQLKPKLPPQLYAQADATLAQLQAGRLVPNTPPELDSLFRASVQPYLISWFRYDPAAEIAKTKTHNTIVQGTADIQVSLVDANDLHHGDPASTLVVVDGMNHMLKHAPDTKSQDAIYQGYEDPSLPIEPQVVDTIVAASGVVLGEERQ
jgi:alpha-beta hydrolase superfamily lysophospholipase